MAKFKEPLSKHPWHIFGQGFKGAGNVDIDALIDAVISTIPKVVLDDYGFEVAARKETITIGGFFNSKDQPGVVFSFTNKPDYASILVGFNKVGNLLDVEAVQYGSVSKNMYHSNAASNESSFSLSGLAKKAYHSVMTDTSAVEEEHMHYDAIVGTLKALIDSWVE